MNINLKNLSICENIVVSFDGKVSIINMFSDITAQEFPALHPKMVILVSIDGENGPHSETVEIIAPDGKTVVATVTGKADIQGPGGNNFVANFINTQINSEGQYWIKVTVDGKVITNRINHFINVKKP